MYATEEVEEAQTQAALEEHGRPESLLNSLRVEELTAIYIHPVLRDEQPNWTPSMWKLSEEDLSLKENLCEDILKILEALKAGECGVKGHVLYELSQCLAEQGRRILALRDSFSCQGRKIIEKAQKSLQAAERIFVDDITAPTHHKKVVLNGKPL